MTPRSPTLLPLQTRPQLERLGRLSARIADTLDAILVIIPADASPELFATLPHAQAWRQMLAGRARNAPQTAPETAPAPLRGAAGGGTQKPGPGPGSIRSVNLANARQTRLILGVMPRNASAFETLSLAGRMARDLGSCTPGSVALAAPGAADAAPRSALEALLSATLACAFEMPS